MKVRVWNKNFLPYEEVFQGEKIRIEPNKPYIMDEDKAIAFVRKMGPYKVDAGGTQLPESYKKLVIDRQGMKEENAKAKPKPEFNCHGCDGVTFPTEKELNKHIEKYHSGIQVDENILKERNAS